jgi:hypothetical protein
MKEVVGKQRYVPPFTALIIACGAAACIFSASNLPVARFDSGLLLLALLTILLGSRLTMQLPRAKVHVSVSDTLIFLILFVYGGEAAVLVAAAEALYTSFRFRVQGITIRFDGVLFNTALMACSTFLSARALRAGLGSDTFSLQADNATLFTAVCAMALAQYAANSFLAAIYTACQTNHGIWSTWNKKFFPTALTYFAGAATATGLVTLKGRIGFYAIVATATAVTIIYFTIRRYINDLKDSVSQAERAERARAEQAERHVDELNHYVAELKRTTDELQMSKEHFRHAAFHDALTDLPNRALFTDYLKLAIERTKRQPGHHFAVLFMDSTASKTLTTVSATSMGISCSSPSPSGSRGACGRWTLSPGSAGTSLPSSWTASRTPTTCSAWRRKSSRSSQSR